MAPIPVASHSESNLVWSEIEGKAPDPTLAWLARVANKQRISLRALARRCGRKHNNLRKTFLAENPTNESIEEIAVALGLRRKDVRAKLSGDLNYATLKSELDRDLGQFRDECLSGIVHLGSIYETLLDLASVYLDLMSIQSASINHIEFANARFTDAFETLSSLRKTQLVAERSAIAMAEQLLDDLRHFTTDADHLRGASSKVAS